MPITKGRLSAEIAEDAEDAEMRYVNCSILLRDLCALCILCAIVPPSRLRGANALLQRSAGGDGPDGLDDAIAQAIEDVVHVDAAAGVVWDDPYLLAHGRASRIRTNRDDTVLLVHPHEG